MSQFTYILLKLESRAFNRMMMDNGYIDKVHGSISGGGFRATDKGKENAVITDKLLRALYVPSESEYRYKITRQVAKKQFGVQKDDKIPAGYEVRFYDGKYSSSKNDDWKVGTWFASKGPRILKINFETQAEAVKWVQDFAKQRSANGKTKFVPPQLAHVKRDGPDYRRGRNMEGQDFIATFGFKGGEFGNWMSQIDRQGSLNMGYEALKDLAAALKISDKDISYQGELSIAFGARGGGTAVAHYEPARQVINLTKMRGAGSLAHEWWHGFDDFMGRKMGTEGLLSEHQHKHPLFKKLIDTIKYKPETPEQAAARAESADNRTKKNAEGWLKHDLMPFVNRADNEKVTARFEALKEAYLRGEPGTVDKLNDLKKETMGNR